MPGNECVPIVPRLQSHLLFRTASFNVQFNRRERRNSGNTHSYQWLGVVAGGNRVWNTRPGEGLCGKLEIPLFYLIARCSSPQFEEWA